MASLSWPASPIHVVTGLGVDQLRRSRPTRFDRYTKPASQIPCSLINTPRRIGYVGRPTAFGRYVFHTPGEKRNYVVGLWAFAALRTVIMCYNVDANWYFHLPVATVERRYTCPVLYWCCTDPNVDIRGPPIHLQLVRDAAIYWKRLEESWTGDVSFDKSTKRISHICKFAVYAMRCNSGVGGI